MKKNKVMRLASVLLVLTLLSTSVISGTFAKYTTSATGSDSARVAKWGVTVVSTGKMFGEHYNGTTDDKVALAYTGSVDSQGAIPGDGESNIVAPGTKGDMVSVVLSGKPEVAVKVVYEEVDLVLTNWKIDGDEYCPIVFTVGSDDYYIGKSGITNIAELESAVEHAISYHSAGVYPAGTDLSAVSADALRVSWRWEFEKYTVSNQDNDKDTSLGNQTAAGAPATISLSITTTVTQVD